MKRTYDEALALANEFIQRYIQGEYVIAGSIRRKEAMIGDVDIITTDSMTEVEAMSSNDYRVEKVNGGEKKMDMDFKGMRFNIYRAKHSYWGAMLFFLTGPAGYSIAYRKKAKAKHWHLDQYGLKDENGNIIAAKTERAIYKAFGKDYKEPEWRGR